MTDTKTENPKAPAGFYTAIGVIFAISLAITVYFIRSMSGGMNMPGGWKMSMMWMRMPAQNWFAQFSMFQLMWLTMMVAMMLPSTAPMLLNVRRSLVQRNSARPNLSTELVAGGYFIVWSLVGIIVYAIGVSLSDLTMRSPVLSNAVPIISAGTLVLAGAFQVSRWKWIGLNRCRDPLVCSPPVLSGGKWRALSHGFSQGIFCVICCSGLMLILLAVGIMNPFAMFAVALIIGLEKLLAVPRPVTRLTGVLAALAGISLLAVRLW